MTIKDKAKALNKIDRQIIRLMKRALTMAGKPPSKTFKGALKMCGKVIAIAIQIRQLEMQKRIIVSQMPIPKFRSGVFHGGPAIVGESGAEIISKPGGFQTGAVGDMYHELPKGNASTP